MPFQITEQNGATALQFTNWTIVFEMIAAQPKLSGATGVLSGASLEKRFGAVVVKQFHASDGQIVSINNQTFKVLDGGGRLMFSDRTYDLKKGPKVVLVGKDGKTHEQ